MKAEALYHSGIVVEDFDAAMAWFTETAGYRWTVPYAGDVAVTTPDGEITMPMRLTYSIEEPRLELIQAVPGTLWTPADSGVHHLGYWSDDVDADLATLAADGLAMEAQAALPDGSLQWAYCKAPHGPRIELVSRRLEPALSQMWASD